MNVRQVDAVLFDLDGTLIDTAGDLLGALDDLRAAMGLPAVTQIFPPAVAARGGRGILKLGFPDIPDVAERYLPRYLDLYAARIAHLSRPYPGIEPLLVQLMRAGVAVGIVTNKPESLARLLLRALGWDGRQFRILVGGDTLAVRKPAPEPIWHACKALHVEPERSVMVGDDRRDIASGLAAGCFSTIAVAYGYVETDDDIQRWGAQHCLDTPAQLAQGLLSMTGVR